ncbi:hypothetical protein FA13DRAFT_1784148 [Coprinellus micaceus]|uniref:H-type lectin domain-containing protein n=1 Tax=Coprinellus micaceus TaxID=71717 RepID=A0A4Y7U0R6_COPMI|nr:hypothetical protein FA13DRAFT_1784148 [Coprinellus micaceus]
MTTVDLPQPVGPFKGWNHSVRCIAEDEDTSGKGSTPAPKPKSDSRVSVVFGRYSTSNHWSQVVRGAHYSSALHFQPPLRTVPRILTGLSMLDIGDDARGATIRVDSFPQNVTQGGFICNGKSWMDTKLYNLSVDWAAIEEPGWQCGVFKTQELGEPWEKADSVFDHRIAFRGHFTSPPMVFVCFNGIDMCGNWNVRTYATKIDHTGFNLSIAKSDDGDSSTRLWSASVTWIAIPGVEVLKRKDVWMGQFGTARKGDIGGDGSWRGRTDFGFQFRRPPKVFMGLDHFNLSRRRNLRLLAETTNVTVSGMDWKISKWHDTMLKGASVSYLAVDCADR